MKRLIISMLLASWPAFCAFSYKIPVVIDHTKVGGSDLADFPVLLKLSATGLKTTGNAGHVTSASGYDVNVFSNSGLTTPLVWQQIAYDGSAGTWSAWVKIPTLSHTVDTTVYVGLGDATITTFQSTATSAWNAGYHMVYHLNETSLGNGATIADSTATGINLTTNTANQSASTSPVGASVFFTNTGNQYTTTGAFSSANAGIAGGNTTVEGLVKLGPTFTADAALFMLFGTIRGTYPNGTDSLYVFPPNGVVLGCVGGDNQCGTPTDPNYLDTTWHHIAMAYDHSTIKVYYDGIQVASDSNSSALIDKAFGINSDLTTYGENAYYAEVRASTVARSADWILATANSTLNPTTFAVPGSEVSTSGGAAPTPGGLML